jgi:iron(III) transport system permease protein
MQTLKRLWARAWRGQPPQAWLSLFVLVVALMMAAPVAYVFMRGIGAGIDQWSVILDQRVPGLLWNTLSLAAVVAFATMVVGVGLAWLVHRTDLPGRRVWRWLLALPLAVPPYVGAMSYIVVLGPRGWANQLLGYSPLPIFSFAGVAFVLATFTYPYVFLVAGAALSRMGRAHEEAARSLGASSAMVFWKVTLPMLRPAMGAGAILVVLYVLSDFGAVAILRFTTFTAAIYYRMGGYDTTSAAILSVILIALTLVVLAAEGYTRRRARFHQSTGLSEAPPLIALGRYRAPALAAVITVFTLAAALPIAVLVYWSIIGAAEGVFDARFWTFTLNTLQVAGIAALASMAVALPVVYLGSRHPSLASTALERLAYSGYALPGVIVAIGMIFFSLRFVPVIYNTLWLVALAYVVRFMPQAMQSTAASLAQVSPRIDEAARVAGMSQFSVIARVISRLTAPGMLAGAALVFVSSMKELPATLLLRPIGFDTLSVRVWVEAAEGAYHLAAPAALVIVVISMLPLKFMLDRS